MKYNRDDTISEKTLQMIDKSAQNLAKDKAGKPINFNEFLELLKK